MADTQRTRSAILTLFADNVTGQISAQDLRDFVVTMMESEFANPGDFWKHPSPVYTTTDQSARGWIDYSQTVGSDCSFMNMLYLNTSGIWMRADVADSTKTGIIGMAVDDYTSDASTCQILRQGMVYNSAFSGVFSGYIGRPIYLDSGVPGSISVGETAGSQLVVGFVAAQSAGDSNIGKFYFYPEWAVRGE
jgi:hypothetical protein